MPEIVPLRVQLVAKTEFLPPADVPWDTDADGGQALAEFAGRACYQSWAKPNPRTATNAGYLRHILEVGHLSVLEHGTVSFYLTGVSRSLTHELIRHRHFSYSQLSQRYVPERDAAMVEPEVIAADPELHALFTEAAAASVKAYEELLDGLEKRFADVANATLRRKQARQAARAILPNATETRIVVTGNYRAWRHFIAMRATEHADVEIRELAVECLRQLQREVPNVFGDFEIGTLDDGTRDRVQPVRLGGLTRVRPRRQACSRRRVASRRRSAAAPAAPRCPGRGSRVRRPAGRARRSAGHPAAGAGDRPGRVAGAGRDRRAALAGSGRLAAGHGPGRPSGRGCRPTPGRCRPGAGVRVLGANVMAPLGGAGVGRGRRPTCWSISELSRWADAPLAAATRIAALAWTSGAVGVYSRLPLRPAEPVDPEVPGVRVQVDGPAGEFVLYALHVPPALVPHRPRLRGHARRASPRWWRR